METGAGGWFGAWTYDDEGLPCFDYAPHAPGTEGLVLPGGDPRRPWHQVGNAAVIATAHAGGEVTLYATARGFVCLTGPRSTWGLPGVDPRSVRARFGVGYARWSARSGDARLTRRVSAPAENVPALRIDVTVATPHAAVYEERWDVAPVPLLAGALMSRRVTPPSTHTARERAWWRALFTVSSAMRSTTDTLRRVLARRLARRHEFLPEWRAVVFRPLRDARTARPHRGPRWFDPSLPLLFVASLGDADSADAVASGPGLRVAVPAGETRLAFAVGLAADEDDLGRVLHAIRASPPGGEAAEARARIRVEMPGQPEVEREAVWHASYLLGAQVADAYFGHRYVTQGSAYAFVHGVQGAPRDYAMSAVPLAFFAPDVAREVLQVMMRMTRPDGAMHYAHTGYGRCTSGGVHAAPTDLPLFLLWALSEYVWATGDDALLDERVPFYPAEHGRSSTARERVLLAFSHVRDRVGRGPHGMLRVGSGDWADPISAMVRDRRAFHRRGESGFNTAFAAYVLPRAADLVCTADPGTAAEMRATATVLRGAMEEAWTGRWFLRGWDGEGRPVGGDHLFLDGQVWALIARIGTDAQRLALVRTIAERCDDPSPIGATILDRPHPVRFGMLPAGWDCNGGVWAAINALLAWGYALHDPALAWRSLAKQSLAAHARAYPHVWYGIWSGPDAYNAHFGDRPGETFVQPATPMTEFPVMNSNAHAGPLLALLRVLGLETTPAGIVLRESRGGGAPWRLATPLGTFSGPLPVAP